MRLLTICHMFPCQLVPRYGIFLVRQMEYLADHGIKCTFLVPRPFAPWPLFHLRRFQQYGPKNPLTPNPDQDVHPVRFIRPPGGWFRVHESGSISKAIRGVAHNLHSDRKFDAVFACPLSPDSNAASQVSKELGLPLATLAIGSDVMVHPREFPGLVPQIRETLTAASLSIGVSQSICDRLRELGANNPLRVYLGRDDSKFTPTEDKTQVRDELGWEKDRFIAVMVSRVEREKGTRELADACLKLSAKHPHFRMVIVGDGAGRAELEAIVAERNLSDCVIVTGEQPPERIPLFLQGSDLFVLPSYSEGMPQAVLEAMNCGLPVVGTRVGGIPEAVADGENGTLIEPKNAVALEQAIEQFIDDETLRQSAGLRSQQIAKDVFGSEANAAILASALKKLAP